MISMLTDCLTRYGPTVFKTYIWIKQYINDTLILPYFGSFKNEGEEYDWDILDAEIEHQGQRIELDEMTIEDLKTQMGNVVRHYFENHPQYDWNDSMKLHITWIKDDSYIHTYSSHELIQPKTTEE